LSRLSVIIVGIYLFSSSCCVLSLPISWKIAWTKRHPADPSNHLLFTEPPIVFSPKPLPRREPEPLRVSPAWRLFLPLHQELRRRKRECGEKRTCQSSFLPLRQGETNPHQPPPRLIPPLGRICLFFFPRVVPLTLLAREFPVFEQLCRWTSLTPKASLGSNCGLPFPSSIFVAPRQETFSTAPFDDGDCSRSPATCFFAARPLSQQRERKTERPFPVFTQ